MSQTHTSFKDKWENNPKSFYDDLQNPESEITKWLLGRNGFQSFKELSDYLNTRERILDAGCGNGRVTNLFASLTNNSITGVDYSSAEVAKQGLNHYPHVNIKQANLLEDLNYVGSFDFIYCQEVLHHTGDAQKGFKNLVKILKPNGDIAIYVYRKKAPVREFVDDYVRDAIKGLTYEEAMRVSAGITEIGKKLSEIDGNIKVPELKELGIQAGEYSVQRFFYHFFMKCFWNNGLSWNENVAINYDWYHPEDCTRHTIDEVRSWFQNEKLEITKSIEDNYGITMWGKKGKN